MGYALIIIGYVIYIVLSISCLICIASIISHIVRRHILWDRQQDLVCKINWNIQQQENSARINPISQINTARIVPGCI